MKLSEMWKVTLKTTREYLNYKEIEKKSTDKLNEDDQNGLQFLPRTRKTEARKTKTQRSKSNECDLPHLVQDGSGEKEDSDPFVRNAYFQNN